MRMLWKVVIGVVGVAVFVVGFISFKKWRNRG